jgi:hypothetical protein
MTSKRRIERTSRRELIPKKKTNWIEFAHFFLEEAEKVYPHKMN